MAVNASAYRPRVAFQGEHGAFSEEAAIKLLGPEIELVPRPTFASLFRSLDEGLADYALAPVENSVIGIIRPSFDLFEKSSLVSVGEVIIPIAQHLIACPGVSFAEIEEVQSHPVALAQCARFFIENPGLQKIEAEDTAGSVANMIERGERKLAAIAGRRAAELYGGSILKKNIQDQRDNQTKFLLLSGSAEWSPLLNKIAESKRNTNHDR
jgi:prephenate dehydratase